MFGFGILIIIVAIVAIWWDGNKNNNTSVSTPIGILAILIVIVLTIIINPSIMGNNYGIMTEQKNIAECQNRLNVTVSILADILKQYPSLNEKKLRGISSNTVIFFPPELEKDKKIAFFVKEIRKTNDNIIRSKLVIKQNKESNKKLRRAGHYTSIWVIKGD